MRRKKRGPEREESNLMPVQPEATSVLSKTIHARGGFAMLGQLEKVREEG